MLIDLMKHTATVKEKQSVLNDDWEYDKSDVVIYQDIACQFYKPSQRLNLTDASENTDLSEYSLITGSENNQIKQGMIIEVSHPNIWKIWDFVVKWVKENDFLSWSDSLQIQLKAR